MSCPMVLKKTGSRTREKVILRIRDNCSAFNPSARAKVMASDDICKNIGIRLVYRIAEEVNYQNLLGLNVLTIRI